MNPKWFEEVDGKPSRFADLYHRREGGIAPKVAHAFRTLIAEDAAAEETLESSANAQNNLYSELISAKGTIATLQAKLDAANAALAAYRAREATGRTFYIRKHSMFPGYLIDEDPKWGGKECLVLDMEAAIAPAVEQEPMFMRKINDTCIETVYAEQRKGERRQGQAKGTLDLYGERVFYRSGEGFDPCMRYKASRCTSHPRRAADRRQA